MTTTNVNVNAQKVVLLNQDMIDEAIYLGGHMGSMEYAGYHGRYLARSHNGFYQAPLSDEDRTKSLIAGFVSACEMMDDVAYIRWQKSSHRNYSCVMWEESTLDEVNKAAQKTAWYALTSINQLCRMYRGSYLLVDLNKLAASEEERKILKQQAVQDMYEIILDKISVD